MKSKKMQSCLERFWKAVVPGVLTTEGGGKKEGNGATPNHRSGKGQYTRCGVVGNRERTGVWRGG